MDDDSHDGPDKPAAEPTTSRVPKLRPYQIPAAEKKARDEKDAADRLDHLKEMREDTVHPRKRHRFLRFFGWLLLIVVLTGGIGVSGWYFFLRQPMAEVQSQAKAAQTASTPPATSKADTKQYSSANFALKIDYPASWVVTDSTAKLTVVAPAQKLPMASGPAAYVQTVVTFQSRQTTIAAFKTGNATAIRESERITYAKPSQVQRANSFVSFLNYADSTTKGLDGIYITGDNGYQVGQAIPEVDVTKADPLITVTFNKCNDSKCATPGKAATISAKAWDEAGFAKPLKDLLQSIVVE